MSTNITIVRASKEAYEDYELTALWEIGHEDSEHFPFFTGTKIDGIPMLLQATRHVHLRTHQRDFRQPATEILHTLVELLEHNPDAANNILQLEGEKLAIFSVSTRQVFFCTVMSDRIQLSTYLAYREFYAYVEKGEHTLVLFDNDDYAFDTPTQYFREKN